MNQHHIGDDVSVTITSIAPYGAFCKAEDGSTGLIHISAIGNGYISSVSACLPVGSVHEAVITGAGKKPGTYAFSLKALKRRPRQSIKKPERLLTRKEFNKSKLDSFSFQDVKTQLDGMINREYTRLNKAKEDKSHGKD